MAPAQGQQVLENLDLDSLSQTPGAEMLVLPHGCTGRVLDLLDQPSDAEEHPLGGQGICPYTVRGAGRPADLLEAWVNIARSAVKKRT